MSHHRRGGRAVPVLLLASFAALAVAAVFLAVGRDRLDCSALPSVAAAERALADHPGTQRRVEALNAGYTQVAAGPVKGCPGRGGIEILHATEHDARRIRQLLGPSFHGVPYRLVNI